MAEIPIPELLYVREEHGEERPAKSLAEWALNAAAHRVVADDTTFKGSVWTTFSGVNHNFHNASAPPAIYSSVVLGGVLDGELRRYSTLDEAFRGHAELLERVRATSWLAAWWWRMKDLLAALFR